MGWRVGRIGWAATGACVSFIGRTVETLGQMGPVPSPDLDALYWAISDEIHKYSYPELVLVDSWSGTIGQLGAAVITPDGYLITVGRTTGEYALRMIDTGTSTIPQVPPASTGGVSAPFDSVILTFGTAGRWTAALSPLGNRVFLFGHTSGAAPVIWSSGTGGSGDDLSDWASHGDGPAAWTGEGPQSVVAAGESIWLGVSANSVAELYRFDVATTTLSATGITQVETTAVAVDGQGWCIYQSAEGQLSRVNESMVPEVISCQPALYDGANPLLHGGFTVPGDPTHSVMSHYVDYTGEPDADWIWQWPSVAP